MRHLLESELLATIVWPTPPQLKSLKAMVAEFNQLLASGSRDAWIERHRAFHDAIFDLSENKILKREALRLMRLNDRYRRVGGGHHAPRYAPRRRKSRNSFSRHCRRKIANCSWAPTTRAAPSCLKA
ncbi:DNA-binding GntR family transcriptional regulator [Paraburkholderia sp. WSM4177]|nr:DNA-binding GntR family transcriptional regulator [Paraburkholderia sp. WSM4177]MBB5485237.1 DNA-binding GntR family transcriptional regulator [Paraburkholderia sp. WSM4180]